MDELHLLRTTRNSTGTVLPAVLAAGREKLMQKAAEESARKPATVLHPHRPWRRALAASAAAAALVAALVAVDVVVSDERPGATAEAAEVLNDAAAATITSSDPVLAPGQYLKIKTTGVIMMFERGPTNEAAHPWLASMDRQMYVPADRTGEWVWASEPSTPVQFFGEGSRQASERMAAERRAFGMPMEGEVLRAPGGQWGGSDWYVLNDVSLNEVIKSAPRDPDELLKMIYEQTGGNHWNTEAEAFKAFANILRTGAVPADLRAVIYQAIALIPGVSLVDREATLDGRTGVSLGMKSSNNRARMEIIIDPASGHVIGEREVQLREDKGVPAGTVTAWTAITTSVVDSAP